MEEANYSHSVYATVNTILLVVAISVIATLSGIGNHFATITSEKSRSNTTTVQRDDVDIMYTGVDQRNITVYDGLITGESAYNDIINGNSSIPITLNSEDLSLIAQSGHTSYQDYVQNYAPTTLIKDGRISLTRTYKRIFTMDTDGNVIAVRYIVQ